MASRIRDIEKDDAEYVELCRQGNAGAFEVLVERHQKRMLNIAFRMTGDYDEACDVVQESFLSAFKAIKGFRGDALFSTWLCGIVMNHARNRLKQVKSRSRFESASVEDMEQIREGCRAEGLCADRESAAEKMEREELEARVQKCISALDGEQREVLVLRDIQGFSYDEICRMLNIPDGTIKSRLFRARNAVKECLKPLLGDLK